MKNTNINEHLGFTVLKYPDRIVFIVVIMLKTL